jgi:hypothetical protein
MKHIITAVLLSFIATAALAQTPVAPVAPPASAGIAPAPSSGLSPILTQPSLVQQPFGRAAAPAPVQTAPAPIDQQKTQAYRNDLITQQRALEQQGGFGSEQYRAVQQQLNQLNSR